MADVRNKKDKLMVKLLDLESNHAFVGAEVDQLSYVALHSFNGSLWQFHATDLMPDDPAPTHALIPIEHLEER